MIVSIPILSIRSSDMPSASQMHKRLRYFTMVNALVVPLVKAMGKRRDLSPKQQKRTLSGTTLHEIHQLLHNSFLLAVQGTTGHASADMLVNTYAHIQQSSRVELGKKFESGFYAKPDTPSPQAVPAAGEPTISMTALLELLKDADPEMKAKLRLALLT